MTKRKMYDHAYICMTISSFCMTKPRPGMTHTHIL